MRRQTELGGVAAGSSRSARLDPLTLPVRFTASDAVADERVRYVELDRERVILRRAVRGMRIAVNVPLTAFLGVAIRVAAPTNADPGGVTVCLEHRDPALSVPLYAAPDCDDVVAEWQLWARALGLPLLVADDAGCLHEPFAHVGSVRLKAPATRRRRRSAVKARRPLFLTRRKAGITRAEPLIHRNEHEIIARS